MLIIQFNYYNLGFTFFVNWKHVYVIFKIYWSNATRILAYIFVFIFIKKIFFMDNTSTTITIWLRWQNSFGHARTNTGLLDENRKSCCMWNWLILYGNHVCHSTVHWMSLMFQRLKIPIFDVEIRGRANGRWDGCPVVVIFRSLPYRDRGRNITKHVKWWMYIYST